MSAYGESVTTLAEFQDWIYRAATEQPEGSVQDDRIRNELKVTIAAAIADDMEMDLATTDQDELDEMDEVVELVVGALIRFVRDAAKR